MTKVTTIAKAIDVVLAALAELALLRQVTAPAPVRRRARAKLIARRRRSKKPAPVETVADVVLREPAAPGPSERFERMADPPPIKRVVLAPAPRPEICRLITGDDGATRSVPVLQAQLFDALKAASPMPVGQDFLARKLGQSEDAIDAAARALGRNAAELGLQVKRVPGVGLALQTLGGGSRWCLAA